MKQRATEQVVMKQKGTKAEINRSSREENVGFQDYSAKKHRANLDILGNLGSRNV